jgi:hypothetical protein
VSAADLGRDGRDQARVEEILEGLRHGVVSANTRAGRPSIGAERHRPAKADSSLSANARSHAAGEPQPCRRRGGRRLERLSTSPSAH